MRRALVLLLTVFLAALAVTSKALEGDLQLQNAETRSGKPGEYVTLAFPVIGKGEYSFALQAPDGWEPLSANRTLTLEGGRTLVFTVRVPLEALADQVAVFKLVASQLAVQKAVAQGNIRVAALGGLRMRAPDEVILEPGDAVRMKVFVTNTGNARDTVRLSAVRSLWRVALEPSSFALAVGESREVQVTLFPNQQFGRGYIYLLRVQGESSLDASATNEVQVLFRFGAVQDINRSTDPQLNLGLRFSVAPSLTLAAAKEPSFGLNVEIAPSLDGTLSDFAKGSLDPTGGFGWSSTEGFSFPSGLALGVNFEQWDASLRASGNELAFSISYAWSDWRLGVGVGFRAQQGVAFNATLASLQESLGLQLYLSSSNGFSGARSDALGADYQLPLSEAVTLTVGGTAVGSGGGGSPYSFGLLAAQSLRWQTDDLELFQALSAAPLSGAYSLSAFGALRNTTPFGLRGGSSLSIVAADPLQFTWRNTVIGNVTPFEGLTLIGSAGYTMSTQPTYSVTWNAAANASYGFRIPGLLFGSADLGYAHVGAIEGQGQTSDAVTAGFTISAGDLQFGIGGSFATAAATPSSASLETTRANAQLSYLFTSSTALTLRYDYQLRVSSVSSELHDLSLAWTQVWSSQFISSVSYARTLSANFTDPNINGDAIGVGLGFSDLLLEGLSLNVGWQWSSAKGSVFDPAALSQHRFSLGLGFNLNLPFDTPALIVDAFGGRRGGALRGVAFLDGNLNGKRDANEAIIPNLTLRLGRGASVTTDANGRFELRAPVGKYALSFPSGLEAGLDLLGERTIAIALNQTEERDLGFAPVTSLDVTLYDDLNNNGRRDADENGIPYGGVRIEGPISKAVRVDSSGNATISGLVSGLYTVIPNPQFLPADYLTTTTPVEVRVTVPAVPAPVEVGAAVPPRAQDVTFESNNLALFANSPESTVPPGADVNLEALTQGKVDRVTARFGGIETALQNVDGRWTAVLRLPLNAPFGATAIQVRAYAGSEQVSFEVPIIVVDAPLFITGSYRSDINSVTTFELQTLYKVAAGALAVVFPDGQRVVLTSDDGYRWRGQWKAPASSGRLEAKLFDGERLLGTLNFVVTVPATLGVKPLPSAFSRTGENRSTPEFRVKQTAPKHGSLLEQLWSAISGTAR